MAGRLRSVKMSKSKVRPHSRANRYNLKTDKARRKLRIVGRMSRKVKCIEFAILFLAMFFEFNSIPFVLRSHYMYSMAYPAHHSRLYNQERSTLHHIGMT